MFCKMLKNVAKKNNKNKEITKKKKNHTLTSSKVCVKKDGAVQVAAIFNINIASDTTYSVRPSYLPVTRKFKRILGP